LSSTDPYDMVINLGHLPVYIGDGSPPATAVRIGAGFTETINNFFGTSMGAATHLGNKFFVIASAAGDATVYTSTDSGATWTATLGGPTGIWADYGSMQRVDEYLYFFLSVDGGANWAIYPF